MIINPMSVAIEEAKNGITLKHGGPFGAVVVYDNNIIGRGHNKAVLSNDPTAHAEIEALRDACKFINSFDLTGGVLYTTCYPCPMCLGAILWARISKVYFCLTSTRAKELGFDDHLFYEVFRDKERIEQILIHQHDDLNECESLFEQYAKSQYIKY